MSTIPLRPPSQAAGDEICLDRTPTADGFYIPTLTRHYAYAILIVGGWSHLDACMDLDICPRTAERWRTDLRRAGRRKFGRSVSYEYCARHATESKRTSDELRALYESLSPTLQKRLRENPHRSRENSCLSACPAS